MVRIGNRVLVTGAAGEVGSLVVPLLLKENYYVTAFDCDEVALEQNLGSLQKQCPEDLQLVRADIFDPNSYLPLLKGKDQIIHLASFGPSRQFTKYSLVLQAHEYFFKQVKKNGNLALTWLKLVCQNPALVQKDSYFTHLHKLEESVKSSGLRYRIISAPMLIGRRIAFWETLVALVRSQRLVALPHWYKKKIQFLFIKDFFAALLHILDNPKAWSFSATLASPDSFSLAELSQDIAKMLNKKVFLHSDLLSPFVSHSPAWIWPGHRRFKVSAFFTKMGLLNNVMAELAWYRLIQYWQPLDNVESFFSEFFHYPASREKIVRDYFLRIE